MRLLVVSSTYPRWANDAEPGFVHELSRRLTADFEVTVVCPAARGAKREETMDGVTVKRYRYAPDRLQTLVNDGGMVTNLKRSPWKGLLLPGFFIAQLFAVWRHVRRVRPDVIHAHWLIPQGLILALLAAVNPHFPLLVVTSHGADRFALKSAVLALNQAFSCLSRCGQCGSQQSDVPGTEGADKVTMGCAKMMACCF